VIYLLDVNALLALGIDEHEFHQRTVKWVKQVAPHAAFATCAITELGFLRVLLQAYSATTVPLGQKLLMLLKSSRLVRYQFLADDQDTMQLPAWVQWPNQITGGHLMALAKAHNAALASLDQSIRGAFIIPR